MSRRRERMRFWLTVTLPAVVAACAMPVELPPGEATAAIVEDVRLGRIDACRDPRWIAWRLQHGEQGTARLTAVRDQARAKWVALDPPPPDVDAYEWSDQRARLDGLLYIARAALAATAETQWSSTLAGQEERVRAWRAAAATHVGDGFAQASRRRAVWVRAWSDASDDLAEQSVEARMALCLVAIHDARSEADSAQLVSASLDRDHWPSDDVDGEGATRAVLSFRGWSLGRSYLRQHLARLDEAAAKGKIPRGGWLYLRGAVAKYPTPKAFAANVRKDIQRVRRFFAGLHGPRTIGDELHRRARLDQFAIGAPWTLAGDNPANSASASEKKLIADAFADIFSETAAITKENAERVKVLLRDRDWFDDAKDGEGATSNAWLLVQHADHDRALQRDVLRRMEPPLGTGRIAPWHYAYLWDRVAVGEKRLQRYGTQMTCVDGKRRAQIGLEDPERVDERRRQVGLGPWTDYVASFGPCESR